MDNGISSDPFVEVLVFLFWLFLIYRNKKKTRNNILFILKLNRALLPGSKENKHKFRSSTKRKTLDPEYLEEFKFTNIDLRTLLTKRIEISVWDKDLTKNDFIGNLLYLIKYKY